jgi:hypothetical protein
MRVKDASTRGYLILQEIPSIDKLRSKNFQSKPSSDNFVHLLDDSNKLVDKVDTIGINEFVKKLKPKCIQIIDLLFFIYPTRSFGRVGNSLNCKKHTIEIVLMI